MKMDPDKEFLLLPESMATCPPVSVDDFASTATYPPTVPLDAEKIMSEEWADPIKISPLDPSASPLSITTDPEDRPTLDFKIISPDCTERLFPLVM